VKAHVTVCAIAVLAACAKSPARVASSSALAVDAGAAASSATTTAESPPPIASPPPADAGAPEPPPAPPFVLEDWLAAHGIKQWKPDATCWSRFSFDKTMQNVCNCGDPLRLAVGVELLQCTRASGSVAPSAPMAHRTILYVAEAGALRVVFDRFTGIMPDDRGPIVMLGLRAEEKEIVVEESGAGAFKSNPCEEVMAKLEEAARTASPENRKLAVGDRDGYRDVCKTRGRYAWNGRTLVKKN
jgi:hypothetical protein